MRIYIDVSVLTLATYITGIQRATIEIATRLISCYNREVVLLYYNASKNEYYRIDNEAFVAYYLKHKGIKEKMITKEKVPFSDMGENTIFFDLDGVWMGRIKRSYLLPILKEQGCRIVAHIYDIISITHPQYCEERGVYNFMDYIAAHMKYADKIIVNAEATVRELENLSRQIGCPLPECEVVRLGADFRNKDVIEAQVDISVVEVVKSKPYILMVGTLEPRKNHKLLLNAYENRLKNLGYNIIFAGYMGWNMEQFEERLKSHPDFGKGIYHFSNLSDSSVAYLYRYARFLAFCSYSEGFGLPIIEALQRGTPVLAADVPVLREVGGEFCVWFEQDNAEMLCDVVEAYTKDMMQYEKLKGKVKLFKAANWDETLSGINACLEELQKNAASN